MFKRDCPILGGLATFPKNGAVPQRMATFLYFVPVLTEAGHVPDLWEETDRHWEETGRYIV
jgi:hypothetical protein